MYSLFDFLANEPRQNTLHHARINKMSTVHPLTMQTVPDLEQLRAGFPSMKTLLFDMDGTLFDTEIYHTQALQKIGQDHRIHPPLGPQELHQLLMGKADHLIYELVKEWRGFPEHWDVHTFVQEKNRHLLEILNKLGGDVFFSPQLALLLAQARAGGLQLGLVTSSEKLITQELLRLVKLEEFFDLVITRDDSEEVKPSPWPYLKAMEQLGTSHELTVIFEDSSVGLSAATASRAHVIKAEWY